MDWDTYNQRLSVYGDSARDIKIGRAKELWTRKLLDSPACKSVKVNGVAQNLIVNSGTKPYYKKIIATPLNNITYI